MATIRLVAACSPTGMPGPNTAFRNGPAFPSLLPETAFSRSGSMPRGGPARVSDEADVSQRPFAPPQRLPVSGPPLRDRSSRPAASTPCRIRPSGPFGRGLLPSFPVSRIRERSTPATRCRSPIRHSDRFLRSCSSSGLFRSLRLAARPGSSAGSLPPRNVRFRSLPGGGTV